MSCPNHANHVPQKKGKCTDEEFEEWLLEHECDINFTGSSPAMEAEGAVVLWGRSIERHNLRYKWMVSDGDGKAFNSVEHIYDDITVEKLDCGKIALWRTCSEKNGKALAEPES